MEQDVCYIASTDNQDEFYFPKDSSMDTETHVESGQRVLLALVSGLSNHDSAPSMGDFLIQKGIQYICNLDLLYEVGEK